MIIKRLKLKYMNEVSEKPQGNEVNTVLPTVFVVIKCGYEGIEGLIYATLNADEATEKVKTLRDEILSAKSRMNKINEEFGEDEDEDYTTHYDRMQRNGEISYEEYSMAKYDKPDAFCAQKWDGKSFGCACKELNCEPDEMWLM